jgi:hypothetical protein
VLSDLWELWGGKWGFLEAAVVLGVALSECFLIPFLGLLRSGVVAFALAWLLVARIERAEVAERRLKRSSYRKRRLQMNR